MGKVILTQIGASLLTSVFFSLCLMVAPPSDVSEYSTIPIIYSVTATVFSFAFISGLAWNDDLPGIKCRWIFGALLLQLVLLYTIVDNLMFGLMNWGIIASTAITAAVIIHRTIVRYRLVKGNGLPKAVVVRNPS